MPDSTNRYDHAIAVDPADIDFMGHVNNANYLNWVQDAVLSHWQKIAPPQAVAQHLWVALKHEITYRKPAFLEDTLIATSIAERVQGASAFFETVIRRGEEVIAEVKSRWCCIDADTQRPKYIAKDVAALFLPREA
ncbi:MAG: acyl-CoA thioesterase [Sphingomonadaceae bacterium]|nr:acyl-CoA thioesterase [Sphingomonadaceae bacterium]